MTDEIFMKRAIFLAKKGAGRTSPNPLVGAVIVREGRIIGEGYHQCCGGPHAEIVAMGKAREAIEGATIYVNLEPCCHYGRTPACVDTIVARRPARVVVGTLDPNPLVCGRGLEILARQGISVRVGVLERECLLLNEVFFKWIKTGLPFVTLKYAQSLDGRIATRLGDSRWISSPAARKFAHRLRATHDAIMVGSGTVIKDDPELTTRLVPGKNPLRVIVDSRLSLPLASRVLSDQEQAPTILATTNQADPTKRRALAERGVEIIICDQNPDQTVDLAQLLVILGKRNITSLLVEGGAKIITAFLAQKLVDRLVLVQAPKIIGRGVEAIGGLGIERIEEAIRIETGRVRRLGGDLILDGRIAGPAKSPESPPLDGEGPGFG